MDANREKYFGQFFSDDDRKPLDSPDIEALDRDEFEQYVQSRFSGMAYILGLALDFLLLAQQIAQHDSARRIYSPSLTLEDVFKSHPLVELRGTRQANTLSLKVDGKTCGIRKLEETVRSFFYSEHRLGYPSAYVYNTGQWKKYEDLLLLAFRMSSRSRYASLIALLDFGGEQIPAAEYSALQAASVGRFEFVLEHYPRSASGENGGLSFQAICFAYVTQAYGHLFISVDKVRSGSARQKRIGDVDAFSGESLVLSFEVKDLDLNEGNCDKEISEFLSKVGKSGVQGGVFCKTVSEGVEAKLKGERIWVLDQRRLVSAIRQWDVIKQDAAINAMAHYLANVEHNEGAVARLQHFLIQDYSQDS